MIKLDEILSEFETLKNIKPQATRKAAIMLSIKEALPVIFEQLIRPNMGNEDIKRAMVASRKYMGIGVGTSKCIE